MPGVTSFAPRLSSAVVLLVLSLAALFTATPATADDCTALGGNIVAGECVIDGTAPGVPPNSHAGSFSIGETLRIKGTGVITVPVASGGNTLTITVAGDFFMEDGAAISGDASGTGVATGVGANITITASGDIVLAGDSGNGGARITANQTGGSCTGFAPNTGRGGNITLVSSGGDITAFDGSVISVDGAACPAGDIAISALPSGKIDLDGLVESKSALTGTGGGQAGGGRITVKAGCDLTVSETGVVRSEGKDPGADLVHLEGCTVTIRGLVQSISDNAGHATNVDNACNGDNVVAHPIGAATIFAGCVEIWAGTTLTIDRTNGFNGEVSADGVRNPNRAWIDLFANGQINILNTATTPYAVHANAANGGPISNSFGGLITIKSKSGDIVTSGDAVQANAKCLGCDGGDVRIEAHGSALLGTASIQAVGGVGSNSFGGHIAVQAWNGSILGSAPGELNAGGGAAGAGSVSLIACTTVAYTGTVTPATVPVTGTCDTSKPDIPATLPAASCSAQCGNSPGGGSGSCLKAPVRAVLDTNTGRFPGNKGPDAVVRLDLGQSIQDAVDNTGDLNGDGYIIILVVKDGTGLWGGNTTQSVVVSKDYSPARFALLACSVVMHAPAGGIPTGHITTTAASISTSPEQIFIMDLHGADSTLAGWLVEGDQRYVRNTYGLNSQIGLWFLGNDNVMHNGKGEGNSGAGVLVQGQGNLVISADAFANGSHGFQVVGSTNTLNSVDAGDRSKGNGGDGIHVSGALDDSAGATGNQVLGSNAFANAGHGVFLLGDVNVLKGNDVGDRSKGNLQDGVHLVGNGNQLTQNDAFSNSGTGLFIVGNGNTLTSNRAGDVSNGNGGDGFNIAGSNNTLTSNLANANAGIGFNFSDAAGTGNKLKNDQSNQGNPGGSKENGGCEYGFAEATTLDLGGNKKDNATFVGTGSPKRYPAQCFE